MRHIHALAFNAVTAATAEADWWVPLSVRETIAAAVEAAIETEIRADERERQAGRDAGGEYCNVCENFPCLGNHPPVAIV